ncbi:MAG: LysR family transcriptional regulator [Rhodanobacter sp.]
MRGNEYVELTSFVAVARERSFRRAAQQLGLSPSALSRRLQMLEDHLGVRLLNRTTRSVATTEAGEVLYQRLQLAMAEVESAVVDVATFRQVPRGRVRINLPRLAADMIFAPLLGRLAARFPEIQLELTLDDAFADIVGNGFDAGVRGGQNLAADMVGVRLSPDLAMAVVGSPDYFARHPTPQTPMELVAHTCINYRWAHSGALFRWPFDGPDGPFEVNVTGGLLVNDMRLMVAAALQGCGLACVPVASIQEHLDNAALLRVLQPWHKVLPGFFLYFPGRRHTPAAVRAVIDFLKVEMAGTGTPAVVASELDAAF